MDHPDGAGQAMAVPMPLAPPLIDVNLPSSRWPFHAPRIRVETDRPNGTLHHFLIPGVSDVRPGQPDSSAIAIQFNIVWCNEGNQDVAMELTNPA